MKIFHSMAEETKIQNFHHPYFFCRLAIKFFFEDPLEEKRRRISTETSISSISVSSSSSSTSVRNSSTESKERQRRERGKKIGNKPSFDLKSKFCHHLISLERKKRKEKAEKTIGGVIPEKYLVPKLVTPFRPAKEEEEENL